MSPEEYQRIKEAEKERLRSVKKLKKALSTLRHQREMREALGRIASSRETLDSSEALLDELAAETARYEARLEIALDAADTGSASPEADNAPETESREQRARALLRQLKQEVGDAQEQRGEADPADKEQAAGDPAKPEKASSQQKSSSEEDLPDKTIGRMK